MDKKRKQEENLRMADGNVVNAQELQVRPVELTFKTTSEMDDGIAMTTEQLIQFGA